MHMYPIMVLSFFGYLYPIFPADSGKALKHL